MPPTTTGDALRVPARVNERVHWRTDGGGSRYRTRRSFPTGPAHATVLLAGPGTVGLLDGSGRDDLLLQELTHRLVGCGVQVLQCDMPIRDPGRPAGEADISARADRLDGLLRGYRHLTAGPVSMVGFAVGGEAMLRLLETGRVRQVDRLVLVGTVLEEETFLDTSIEVLSMVYGSLDLIGYLVEDDPKSVDDAPLAVLSPDLYAEWSARRLIGSRPLSVTVWLLKGLGHTLHPCVSGPVPDPVTTLTELVTGPR
ncbi:hypothetical protein [Streptacidiphilus sp. EB129]|uniref:hypothetical protein n=1 Tax=Streptacidiphilus sp. EB129 TaxID=3156262 RepID=UPI003510F065